MLQIRKDNRNLPTQGFSQLCDSLIDNLKKKSCSVTRPKDNWGLKYEQNTDRCTVYRSLTHRVLWVCSGKKRKRNASYMGFQVTVVVIVGIVTGFSHLDVNCCHCNKRAEYR